MSLSLNVLGYTVQDKDGLIAWCAAAKPPFVVVMDDLTLAARVAETGAQIIFRRYRPDDAELPSKMKPADFLDSVADVPAAYIVQAGNEPNGDQALLATWSAALIRQAEQRGRRVAVGNWSVGNPDDVKVAAGAYDLILQALADTGGRHLLSVHEYFHDAPLRESYFIGRYRLFLRRADALGIARPRVVITEHGRDLGGGHDGWRAQGWSEADYARRLEEAQQVYRADGVCACVFGYGTGFEERWRTYDVQGAGELLARMAAVSASEGTDDMPLPDGWKRVRITSGAAAVNVRALPALAGKVISTVKTGDALRLNGAVVTAGGHRWQPVLLSDCRPGFISLNVCELA
jgi:hypothetical protein